jgi:DNA-binding MarR family transcriptional regulator
MICQVNEREDLGSQFARVTRRLMELERPLLDKHGLTMWEYVVLLRLREAPAETQLELAEAIRYDKTRLIALLDRLAQQGMLTREPALDDRRKRTIRLTANGRARLDTLQREIHQMEDQLLTPSQRQNLQRLLRRL